MTQPSPTVRSLLKLVFGASLVGILVWRLDLHAIGGALSHYRWPNLLAALIISLTAYPIAALRWKLFAPRFPMRTLMELTFIGQFYATVLPGQIAGELMKAYRLGKGQIDAERVATSVLVDRMVGLVALLLVAGVGIVFSPQHLPPELAWIVVGFMVLLLAGLFAFRIRAIHSLAIHCAGWLTRTGTQTLASTAERAIHAWRDFAHAPQRLLLSLVLGVVFQCMAIAMYETLGSNLGIALSWTDWAWTVAVTSIAVLLPLSIAGLGLREGALIGCLAYMGIAGESAVALSLGVFVIMLIGALIGGAMELWQITRAKHRA